MDVNEIVQVVAAVSSCVAAIAAYWECRLFRKQMDTETYWQQNAKSVEYAQFFANEIIPKSSYIDLATKNSRTVDDIRTKIVDKELSFFNAGEFSRLTGSSPDDAMEMLKSETRDPSSPFSQSLAAAHSYLKMTSPNVALDIQVIDPSALGDASEDEQSLICSINSEALWLEFDSITCSLLNELEYFAMAINSGVVDGDVLYPSLHQVFFYVTRTLYFYICSTNKMDIADRYYTHVTTLYLDWSEKYRANQGRARGLDDGINKGFQKKKRRML